MADNFSISTRDGDKVIATDAISDVHHQRIKLRHGIDGINDGDVARTNPLPVQAYLESGTIHDGSRQMTPKFALINVTATGDATIVTAVANNKIRVLSYVVTGDTAGTFRWESPAGTPISGLMLMTVSTVGSGYVEASFNPLGHFETTSGGALSVEMATANDLQGHLTYVLVPD
jgi:hypothetical protein